MANHGYNPMVAIQMALSGQLYAQAGEWLQLGKTTPLRYGLSDAQPRMLASLPVGEMSVGASVQNPLPSISRHNAGGGRMTGAGAVADGGLTGSSAICCSASIARPEVLRPRFAAGLPSPGAVSAASA